ncbi:DUF1552 domain-containing protein [bacterium]|nr:DUF1552 domain-containing protein [bacterium]
MNKAILKRRTFLRGLGTAIALPMLECMAPVRAAAAATGAGKPPVRMAFMFVPNGMNMAKWLPEGEGANFSLPYILQPFNHLKRDILIMSGLTQDKGRANGDGPGDHARSAAVFLTGVQPLKSEGSKIRAGISCDQFVAEHIANETKFASLEIGIEKGRQAGKCDSGYSCAYSNNISWRDETTPMTKETDPRLVFERLFGNGNAEESANSFLRRRQFKKSILDFVMEDAQKLNTKVSGNDRQKIDEYLTAVREIEQRIEKAEKMSTHTAEVIAGVEKPSSAPKDMGEHIRMMGDMMTLAFQSDVTRVCTFVIANEGSNRPYREIGVNDGHHSISHHQGDPVKLEKIAKINHYHAQQVAYTVNRLKNIKEGDGTLLDNCMIVYGAGICDGNKHNNENLPIMIAGRAGGTIRTGRFVRHPIETPLNNLFLSMFDRMGVHTDEFGDATGRLRGLEG